MAHHVAGASPAQSSAPRPAPDGFRRRAAALCRRRLLGLGAGLTGAGLLGAGLRRPSRAADDGHGDAGDDHGATPAAAGHDPPATATPGWLTWTPTDLIDPPVIRAAAGVLTAELRVDYVFHDIGGYRLNLRGYNGAFPGPTLRARPGDTLRLTLVNDLPPNPDPAPLTMNLPNRFNTTNLHTHGLHVSPGGIADNVFRQMEPGQTYDIEIAIPADHPAGTFWYHPHRHGSADVQVTSGMAGALIIEDERASELAALTERVLIVSEVLFDHLGGIEHYETVWPEAVPRFLAINGQREPVLRLRPGEIQRWRIVQAAHESNFRFALADHQLTVIAYDGISLAAPEAVADLVIAPGQRVDVLIQGGVPGTYALAALPNDQGYPSPTGPFGTVVVAGEPVTATPLARRPAPPLADITDAELTGARRLTLNAAEPEYPPAADYQEFTFLIDGRQFDHDRVDQRVTLGAVEAWTIVNEHADDHVFHIHTNPFQLTHINGAALTPPVWRDTVIVPRHGSITYRTRFLDFTGKLVLHCHMFNHEELGMMQIVEITPPA